VNNDHNKALSHLFIQWCGETPTSIKAIDAASASYRKYYRISSQNHIAVGAYNADQKENQAFIAYTKHFFTKGLSVPELYAQNEAKNIYLLQDLGDTTLLNYVLHHRKNNGGAFDNTLVQLYQKTIDGLIALQIKGHQGLDYSFAYPRATFDKQSMLWDFNYFKYYFLKLAKIPFDEQGLENDFHAFADYLQQVDSNYFLFRDFQARNVMLLKGKPYYIDYQGGRKGALQYDLASLLYQAKANIPQTNRDDLLHYYIDKVSKALPEKAINRSVFTQQYQAYVLLRTMQVLGAYGFRGFYERKQHFLDSIPYALENLKNLLESIHLPIQLPHLMQALHALETAEALQVFKQQPMNNNKLCVQVNSFSYKKGLPQDDSEHGGGFVFDCRAIHNPGRYAPYKKLTGRDQAVIDFLQEKSTISTFLEHVYALVDASVSQYLSRDFEHLMVNFGCTGGQHRSVYCADALAKHLQNKFKVKVVLHHIEQEAKNWQN